jgi:hypothetical protein
MADEGRLLLFHAAQWRRGNPCNYNEKISLIPLAADLPPFAAVASGERTQYSGDIIIDTIGEWYTNGMADEGWHLSCHDTQWRGGSPSNYSEIFLSFLWQLTSLLLQLLPVGN